MTGACTCWRLDDNGTHKASCPRYPAQQRKERTRVWLKARGPRPHITRRWHPRRDNRLSANAKGQLKPWRVTLPLDSRRSPHTEYAATWAEALDIFQWWAWPGRMHVDPDVVPVNLPGRLWLIPNPTNHETESEHDDDL